MSQLAPSLTNQVDAHCSARPTNEARLVDRPQHTPADPRPLTVDQARAILRTSVDDRWHAVWVLMIYLGLRWGEVQLLTWDQVDFDNRVLLSPGRKTKRAKRPLPMPEPVVQALREHRVRQNEERLRVGRGWTGNYVFTSDPRQAETPGSPMRHKSVYAAWHRACDRAGVPRVRLHDARHTTGSLLAAEGVPQRQIMDILRHVSLSTSAWYTEQHDEVLRSAVDLLAARLQEG